jgi:hypothetical protein
LLVLCGQRQKLLRGHFVDDLFREAATPGDLDKIDRSPLIWFAAAVL